MSHPLVGADASDVTTFIENFGVGYRTEPDGAISIIETNGVAEEVHDLSQTGLQLIEDAPELIEEIPAPEVQRPANDQGLILLCPITIIGCMVVLTGLKLPLGALASKPVRFNSARSMGGWGWLFRMEVGRV